MKKWLLLGLGVFGVLVVGSGLWYFNRIISNRVEIVLPVSFKSKSITLKNKTGLEAYLGLLAANGMSTYDTVNNKNMSNLKANKVKPKLVGIILTDKMRQGFSKQIEGTLRYSSYISTNGNGEVLMYIWVDSGYWQIQENGKELTKFVMDVIKDSTKVVGGFDQRVLEAGFSYFSDWNIVVK